LLLLTIFVPGDGDGERLADLYDKPGPPTPLEQRWKLYQSRTGPGPIQAARNEPPKYVILDDRTAHEVLASNIPRTHLAKYWPHDFAGNGSIRARRPNRGRGAIGDLEASSQERFYHATIANRKDGKRYYFTGETDYQPIIWHSEDWNAMIGVFKPKIKRLPTPPKKEPSKWNHHGHNQFTPKDQLVKYGAPRKGSSFRRCREKTRDANGNVRGGRNRVQPLAAMNAEIAAVSRSPENSHSPNTSKRRKVVSRSVSEEADKNKENEDYIRRLEMFLVESKEITDKQKAKIDGLEQKLVKAVQKVELLEAEVTRLQGD
jgi:hypothetical protein